MSPPRCASEDQEELQKQTTERLENTMKNEENTAQMRGGGGGQ